MARAAGLNMFPKHPRWRHRNPWQRSSYNSHHQRWTWTAAGKPTHGSVGARGAVQAKQRGAPAASDTCTQATLESCKHAASNRTLTAGVASTNVSSSCSSAATVAMRSSVAVCHYGEDSAMVWNQSAYPLREPDPTLVARAALLVARAALLVLDIVPVQHAALQHT